jgi:hypothetical protein
MDDNDLEEEYDGFHSLACAYANTLAALFSAEDKIELLQKELAVAYAQGVAHARLTVSSHIDWNPSTVRDDILLNIDHSCTGYVRAAAKGINNV